MAIEKIVALAGGVGGAKLAHGLAQVVSPENLTIVVNVGDDFKHYGLHISPDLDTVMYTLGGVANPQTGWGLQDESWQMLAMLETYGETPWFRLGDRDLGTHILRTHRLAQGQSLTDITQTLCKALGIEATILPATDAPWATMLIVPSLGILSFQDYFVRHKWQPEVEAIFYDTVKNTKLSHAVIKALEEADAIIFCPSNPVLSIKPIIEIDDFRDRLLKRQISCVAVSPFVEGQALKGPATKIMRELKYQAGNNGVLEAYEGLIDGLVVHHGDVPTLPPSSANAVRYLETDIVMKSVEERKGLARKVVDWIKTL